LSLGLGIRLGLAFTKDSCDNNAHHKLVYNIGIKFDGGACNYKNCQRLPVTVYLVNPEELVGRLAIREAMASFTAVGPRSSVTRLSP